MSSPGSFRMTVDAFAFTHVDASSYRNKVTFAMRYNAGFKKHTMSIGCHLNPREFNTPQMLVLYFNQTNVVRASRQHPPPAEILVSNNAKDPLLVSLELEKPAQVSCPQPVASHLLAATADEAEYIGFVKLAQATRIYVLLDQRDMDPISQKHLPSVLDSIGPVAVAGRQTRISTDYRIFQLSDDAEADVRDEMAERITGGPASRPTFTQTIVDIFNASSKFINGDLLCVDNSSFCGISFVSDDNDGKLGKGLQLPASQGRVRRLERERLPPSASEDRMGSPKRGMSLVSLDHDEKVRDKFQLPGGRDTSFDNNKGLISINHNEKVRKRV